MVSAEGTTGDNQGQVRQVHSGETEQDMFTHKCTLTSQPTFHPWVRTAGSLWNGLEGAKTMRVPADAEGEKVRRAFQRREQTRAQVWRWKCGSARCGR